MEEKSRENFNYFKKYMNDNFKVDFIGVAALRSATTWISQCLAEHPQICFSSTKETLFFNRLYNFEKGLKFYRKFFKDCDNDKVKGEYTPSYYLDEEAAKRIKEYFPDVKIFLCLRNPSERAIDHYVYDKRKGMVETPFSEIIGKTDTRYIKDSFYYSYLNKFLKHFNPENVLILIYEDIQKDPREFIKNIYRFLNVDNSFVPSVVSDKLNAIEQVNIRFPVISRLINKRKVLKKYKFGRILIAFLKFIGVNKVIKLILELNFSKKPQPLKEDKKELEKLYKERLTQMYIEDIKKLEKLIKRDLNIWYDKSEL